MEEFLAWFGTELASARAECDRLLAGNNGSDADEGLFSDRREALMRRLTLELVEIHWRHLAAPELARLRKEVDKSPTKTAMCAA